MALGHNGTRLNLGAAKMTPMTSVKYISRLIHSEELALDNQVSEGRARLLNSVSWDAVSLQAGV